jgi:acyl dehydratase
VSTRPIGPAVRWFDDFAIGDRIVTQRRTIVEADGAAWAGLTGDFHPLHVDAEAAAGNLFGARFPAGLMSVAIASGLTERLGLFHGSALAVREQTVRYHAPIRFGDTIRVEMEVAELRPRPEKSGGVLVLHYAIVKDGDTRCADGELVLLMASRPAAGASATYGLMR